MRMHQTVLSVATLALAATGAPAAVLFEDNFNTYSDGNLVGQGPWTEKAAGTAIGVSGGAVVLGPNGQDATAPISPAVSFGSNPGYTFYQAADVTVTTARTGDYFLHTSGSLTSSSFQGRVYVQSAGDGFVLGVGVTSETPLYGTEVLELGQTYRIVLRYDVESGAMNDEVRLYVDPGATEPLAAYVSKVQTTAGDGSALGAVNLRQGAAAAGPNLTVDNFIVTDDYASAVPEPTALGVVVVATIGWLGRRRRGCDGVAR
jgi:hypothetical protein